ncbi:transcriptional attenuator, LytR family [Alteribacillus persepolensis]|uniref:Transcriptional attenuator, LytR family n=1 Tax=Alteribacillus persepolensis TaxID=568899 RepID=A0A1G8GL10_9BACI|nr:LCP family protein [Alteribacillus persepolensis]SDH95105.1 transcriptional attenuator, LytR family [Alteribacillus persepolensis]
MWKIPLTIFMTVLLTLLLFGAGYIFHLFQEAGHTMKQINVNDDQASAGENSSSPQQLRGHGPISIFITGIDSRTDNTGLSDVIMVLSIHPEKESTLLFNIPRDTQVAIPDRQQPEKINHAYHDGGTALVQQIVEQKLEHSFDLTVELDMQGFIELVDILGGIEVDNAFAFSERNVTHTKTHFFDKGIIHLDGERALDYVRMRKKDPRGDLGRNERQRQILTALMQKTASMQTLVNVQQFLPLAENHIKTNAAMEDVNILFSEYRHTVGDVKTFEMQGTPDTQNGTSYYLISDKEWHKAALRLRNHQKDE